jgi:hypothetical protein
MKYATHSHPQATDVMPTPETETQHFAEELRRAVGSHRPQAFTHITNPRRPCRKGALLTSAFLTILAASMAAGAEASGPDITSLLLPRTARCGDNFCNLRAESHFDCPSDCKGRALIVDQNDGNCTSHRRAISDSDAKKPFCDLNAITPHLAPGDTVYVRGGSQNLRRETVITQRGTPSAFITLRNYPGERPVLDAGIPYAGIWQQSHRLTNARYRYFVSTPTPPTQLQDVRRHDQSRLTFGLSNPMSRLLSLDDMETVDSAPGLPTSINAYYWDCNTDTLYARFSDPDFDPNATPAYFTTYNRLLFRGAAYVRLIGLTFQHGIEAVKITNERSSDQSLNRLKVATSIQVYDSTFQSMNMAITDLASDARTKNDLVVDGNTFQFIGANLEVERNGDHGRSARCKSDVAASLWRYVPNRWDHVIYGAARGTTFSNNNVRAGNTWTAVMAGDGAYYGNIIHGDITTKPPPPGFPPNITALTNNIVVQPLGRPLLVRNTPASLSVRNNFFLGTSDSPWGAVIVAGSAATPNLTSLDFSRNIMVDIAPTNTGRCLDFDKGIHIDDAGGNVWFGCSTFLLRSLRKGDKPETTLSAWQQYAKTDSLGVLALPTIDDVSPDTLRNLARAYGAGRSAGLDCSTSPSSHPGWTDDSPSLACFSAPPSAK